MDLTSEGETSAREIARLTEVHASYAWLCGGVHVGYRTLSDFRADRGDVFDTLLTPVLALLLRQRLVELSSVAQDGTRVRASAGAASFRRTETLAELMAQARAHLDAITRAAADPTRSARQMAARKRAAADRLARLEAALAEVPDVTATKARSRAKDATVRVSTTDPEARVMKLGDGGFRPAFDLQFATTTDSARVIVGVDATHRGSDMGQSTPMLAQIEARTGRLPTELLVDGGYTQHDAIDAAAAHEVTFLGPVPKPRPGDTRDPHVPREAIARSQLGACAWAPTTPSSAPSSARRPRRPSTPTPRPTAASTTSRCAASPRRSPAPPCSPSPTTSCASSRCAADLASGGSSRDPPAAQSS